MIIINNNKIRIYTRGNGIYGQDITQFKDIIKGIPNFNDKLKLAIRGELIISKKYGCYYVTLYDHALDSLITNEQIVQAWTSDQVHPSADGLLEWWRCIANGQKITDVGVHLGAPPAPYYDNGEYPKWTLSGTAAVVGNTITGVNGDSAISHVYCFGDYKKTISISFTGTNCTIKYRKLNTSFIRNDAMAFSTYSAPIVDSDLCYFEVQVLFSGAGVLNTLSIDVVDQRFPTVNKPATWVAVNV